MPAPFDGIFCALFATVLAAGITATATNAQANTAPLLGVLQDPDGKPQPGVMIEVWRAEGKGMVCLDLEYSKAFRRVARAPTDKRGRFAIQLPVGLPCQLRVDHKPYARVARDGTLTGEDVTIKLQRGITFSGEVVRRDNGKGVPAAIRAWNRNTREHFLKSRTDSKGRFRFDRMPPGLVRIDVDPDRAMSPPWRDLEFFDGENVELKFEVDRGVVLRGRVVDASTGKPIAGARVGEGWTFNRGVVTNEDGRYELFGFGADGYSEVHCLARGFIKGQVVSKKLKAQKKDVVLDFRLTRGADAVGRVLDPRGKPLANVYVAAITMGPYTNGMSTHDWIPARTNANGEYRIPGLRLGMQHVIMVREAGFASVVYYLPGTKGRTRRFGDVEMRRPRLVRGRVTGSRDLPVDRIKVGLWGANSDRNRFVEGTVDETPRTRGGSAWALMQMYVGYRHVRTDSNGQFAFGDVPPGTYKLNVYDVRNQIIGSLGEVHVPTHKDPKPFELSVDVEQKKSPAPATRPEKRK